MFIKLHYAIPIRSSVECGKQFTLNADSIEKYEEESLWVDGRPAAAFTIVRLKDGNEIRVYEYASAIDKVLKAK